MVEDPPFIGDWHRSMKLGSGGFGVVWLWQNSKTKEKIAVKKCHVSMGPNAPKQKERWEREVDYMTNKIRHVNIVRGLKVKPDSFLVELDKTNTSGMPILLMEYSEGGDLRRALSDSKNASGFPESEVRNILQALKDAVHYLHSLSITHRDIKPENVVFQSAPDGRKTYKLTDLGYAKPIDMRSIEASLVGTMEYIAPELITSDKYSNSVDYWSLGIIGYEIITGTRPFVPHLALAQWMLRVRDKKSDHIAITECESGNFFYSNKIAAENHISKTLGHLLIDWLRLALEWNPKQRGNIFEFSKPKTVTFVNVNENVDKDTPEMPIQAPAKVLKFFNTLDEILSKKILTIFILNNHRKLSMEITDETSMNEFYIFIERETNIPKERCHLVIPLENLNTDIRKLKTAADLYFDGYFDKPMVYVHALKNVDEKFGKSTELESPIAVELPESVRGVLTNHEQKMKVHALRKFANDTLYFVRMENEKYKLSLDGYFNYALQLNHEIEICRKDVNDLNSLVHGLNGANELYEKSLINTKKHMEQTTNDNEEFTFKFQQFNRLKQNVQLLVDACEKIIIRYQSIYRRSRDIHQNEILGKRNAQDFFDIVNTTKAFDALRSQIINKSLVEKPHFELFQCAYKCLKRRDQLLLCNEYTDLKKTLNFIHIELNEIRKALAKASVPAEKYKKELFESNQTLLDSIWKMSRSIINSVDAHEVISPSELPFELSEISKAYAKEPSAYKIDLIANPNITDQFGNRIYCFGEGTNSQTLIEDNKKLRISMDGLIREIDTEFALLKPSS